MLRVTLRSFWAHKRRLVLTLVSIVLGVGFMSATFVLGDTFNQLFDDLFAEGNEAVDAQVQGDVVLTDPFSGQDQRALLPEELVDEVDAVDGVRVAEPYVLTLGFGSVNRVLGSDGKAVGASQGPPTLLESWVEDSELTPYRVAEGRGPTADDEIALNVAAANDGGLAIGDTVRVITQTGTKEYTLVGTVLFGTAQSSAGAVSAEFSLTEAQRLADAEGQLSQVLAGAEDGVSQTQVADAIRAALPDDLEVLTGEEAAAQLSSDVQEGFGFFTQIIQIFALIALLVGIFVISNTFSIILQQRTRELALLRAVGASRRQVLTSVILEAILVGLIGALIGLGVGVLMASAASAAFGDDLAGGIVVSPPTVISALLIGLVVTLVAAVAPAIRATRVPPLAALRDVALDRSGASRARVGLGILIALLGALNLSKVWTGNGTTDDIAPVGIGSALLLLAAIVVGPVLAGPSVRMGGKAVTAISGVTGRLAVENASRSPKRTSATASALLIGVALVGFIAVLSSSAKASITKEVSRGFEGDFVVQSESTFGISGFPSSVSEDVANTDGVDTVVAQAFAPAEITYDDGSDEQNFITAIDPSKLAGILDPRMIEGEVTDLTDDGVLLDYEIARDNDVQVGDSLTAIVSGGATLSLTVEGLTDDENILGYFTITRDTYFETAQAPLDNFIFATVDDGADVDEVIAQVEEATKDVPSLQVLDRDGFIGSIVDQIAFIVNFITILLFLSVIIALIGVINTLNLSVSERVRELGLLRAVGMNRRQLRSSIRWEAIIIAMLGTVIGVLLAAGLGWALVQTFASSGLTEFRVPIGSLVALLIGGCVVGVLAAVFPARRAAKLAILDAIATD